MAASGSYDAATTNRDLDTEIQRLRAQVLLSWEQEARALVRSGLQDGMSILELGCGPGFVTEQLLDMFPTSPVTALEIDPGLLGKAKQYLQGKADGRLRFVEASIQETGLPDNSVDFAIGRLIFQHLPDPLGAAKEVLRVVKPGGKLAIIDIDDGIFGLIDPPIPELPAVLEKYGQAQALRGGNRLIGRRLWRILKTAGFENVEMEAVLTHSDALGIEPFLPQIDPDRLLPLVRAGLISQQELESVRVSRDTFLASPEPFFLLLMLLVCGAKA